VTGAGHFVDDMQPEGCLHIAFVRSTLAHARIRSLDVHAAAAAPGVVAVLTGADLGLPDRVGFQMVTATLARAPLAIERVRFVGEPVALVIPEISGNQPGPVRAPGGDGVVARHVARRHPRQRDHNCNAEETALAWTARQTCTRGPVCPKSV